MKAPAFQFYADSWLSSLRVQLMSLEEEGAYIRCLAYCWRHGSIPADPATLCRLIGKGCSTTLATVVAGMFVAGKEPGELVHERLEEERQKQAAWREKCAAGGRAASHLKGSGKGSINGSTALRTPTPSPSLVSVPVPDLPPPSAPADKRHHEITSRWGDLYKAAFAAPYSFAGRDAAALKRFLAGVTDSSDSLLETASRAWTRLKTDRFAKRCKEAATIHGFCTYFNDIQVELQTPDQNALSRAGNSRSFTTDRPYAGITDK